MGIFLPILNIIYPARYFMKRLRFLNYYNNVYVRATRIIRNHRMIFYLKYSSICNIINQKAVSAARVIEWYCKENLKK